MSVPEGERKIGKLACIIEADKLCRHTLLITKNRRIFTEDYYVPIMQDIIETAKTIYISSWEANDIYVKDKETWIERKSLQDTAVRKCDRLFALMQLAYTIFHLETKKLKYWGTLCVNTRKLMKDWKEADRKRYKVYET